MDPEAAEQRSIQVPNTINWIGALEHKMGRITEAIGSYEQARDVILKLVRDHSQVVRYRQALCIGDNGLAGLYREVGRSWISLSPSTRSLPE
jgi:hypothetical protein